MVYNTLKAGALKSSQIATFKSGLLDMVPLAWLIIALWIKLIYFNMSLRSVWWAPEQSTEQWLQTHPYIFSTSLASLIILFAWAPLVSRFWRILMLFLLNFLVTSLIVADMVHIHFYGDVLSISSLANARFLPRVITSVIKLLQPSQALFYMDILLGAALLPLYLRVCRQIPPLDRRARAGQGLSLLVGGLLLALPTIRLSSQDQNGLFSATNVQYEVVSAIGLLPYHFADAVVHLISRRDEISQAEYQRVHTFLKNERESAGRRSDLFGVAQGKNVILISAESLQTFAIGLEVNGQLVTPRLSAFIKESLYFPNFHDQTYLGTTADGEFTTLQALHPLSLGVVASKYPDHHYHGLPAVLAEQGYTTLAACAAPPGFWNMDQMHPRLGFQQSFFEETYELDELINSWLADREFFEQTMPILQAQQEPFLAFLLSSSNHHPFDLPEKYRVLELGELEGTNLGDYLHSVHYFDQAFGEFLDQLQESGLLDNSMIVMYGDHEGVGEPAELAPLMGLPELTKYHQLLIRKKVPLIIRLPQGEYAGVRDIAGGHLDLTPTVLSLLGISTGPVSLGTDLTQEQDPLVVFRDGSFTDGKIYFINHFGPITNSICYEIGTGRTIDCSPFKEQRRRAFERLEISDLIIRGNLIPLIAKDSVQ